MNKIETLKNLDVNEKLCKQSFRLARYKDPKTFNRFYSIQKYEFLSKLICKRKRMHKYKVIRF